MKRRELLKSIGMFSGAALIGGPSLIGQTAPTGPFTLPALGYAFDALEPFIDAQTMQIHHDRHHAAYVNNLNGVVAKYPDWAKMTVAQMMPKIDTVPAADRNTVRNNAGGHLNHTFFWQCLKKNENGKPTGDLLKAIETKFKSWDQFQSDFSAAATTLFGSGWVWLVKNDKGEVDMVRTFNQDNPWMQANRTPVLGIDVWEHAYYLKYQNRRADYVKAMWNVINWDFVASEYAKKA